MNKYEKLLKGDKNKTEAVIKILKVLDGEQTEDAKEILDAAKFFMVGASTFSNSAAEDWIESLGGDEIAI